MDASLEVATSVFEPQLSVPEQQGPCVVEGVINAADVTKLKQLQQEDDAKKKVRAYWFVVWPESLDISKFFEILRNSGYGIAVSPLHDKDVRNEETGELKKPHYHVIIRFPTARYLEPVRRLVGSWLYDAGAVAGTINEQDATWYVEPVPDYAGGLRYLCHIDNPEKYRYPENEVLSFGFIDLTMLYASSKADDVDSYYQLIAWCRQHPRAGYSRLMDAVYDSEDHGLMRAMQRYSYTLKAYIADRASRQKKSD